MGLSTYSTAFMKQSNTLLTQCAHIEHTQGVWIKNIFDKITAMRTRHFIPPANCVCGWVYCFHVVRPSDRVCVCACVRYVLFP